MQFTLCSKKQYNWVDVKIEQESGQQAAETAHVHAVLPVAKGRLILVQGKRMENREEMTDPW